MARLVLDLNKSIEENASDYYDNAKRIKKKILGAEVALQKSYLKLEELESKREKDEEKEQKQSALKERKKEWQEKFRWFLSSDGFLVVGGRDATSNEVVIKKHAEANDVVLHTDMAGAPLFAGKAGGEGGPAVGGKEALQEAP